MNNIYNKSIEEIYKMVDSSESGLNNDQALAQREKYGLNELTGARPDSFIKIFFSQFTDFLVIILLIAGAISVILKDIESASVIFAVTILNAILSATQHIKAGKALESLKSLSAPIAKAYRNGTKVEIPSKEVVVGDVIFLDAGDYICADGRIINNSSLQVNESSLTGESNSVIKSIDTIHEQDVFIGDQKNMVFSGSLVTYGRATVIITHTGMDTELGKVAALLESSEWKKTPLQNTLDKFGKKLAFVIMLLCALIFGVNLIRGYAIGESFLFAVALAVAAIPEALSSIVTIVLAIGTQKMAKEHAIIRKLYAVESLGGVSVICSDKTGTLTQNKMIVEKISLGLKVIDADKINLSQNTLKRFLEMLVLCNDATINNNQAIGDPTEIALVNIAKKYNINDLDLRAAIPRISELPFDSDRKLMSTLHKYHGELTLVIKGAPDVILARTTTIDQDNNLRQVEKEDIENISAINKKFSQQGLRVLALAYKKIPEGKTLSLSDENELIFAGLVAMQDPPRPESKQAVAECIGAGIKPVMITGDHKITAAAIARQIGILNNDNQAIEGAQIDNLDDEQLKKLVPDISVYARVSPTNKIRIVKAWQNLGHLVAMTGDGVNDAPALKQADIGIAMGKVGTEVAKESADMILTDDNFATIVKAVSNGRSIYSNIKHSIFFLLSGNMAGILAVLYTSIAALPLPFSAVHLLFINLITDSMPAIALGLEPVHKNTMKESPRNVNEPILNQRFLLEILFQGALIATATLAAFYYGLIFSGVALGSTLAFSTLTMARLLHGFNCRSNYPLHKIGLFSNKYQWFALIIGSTILLMVLKIQSLQQIFKVSPEISDHIYIIVLFAFIPLILIQAYKTLIKSKIK